MFADLFKAERNSVTFTLWHHLEEEDFVYFFPVGLVRIWITSSHLSEHTAHYCKVLCSGLSSPFGGRLVGHRLFSQLSQARQA